MTMVLSVQVCFYTYMQRMLRHIYKVFLSHPKLIHKTRSHAVTSIWTDAAGPAGRGEDVVGGGGP